MLGFEDSNRSRVDSAVRVLKSNKEIERNVVGGLRKKERIKVFQKELGKDLGSAPHHFGFGLDSHGNTEKVGLC